MRVLDPVTGGAAVRSRGTLPDLMAEAAANDPEATALIFDGRVVRYRELDERSNRLARC